MYVSATPAPYERQQSGGISAEQIIRPTGLLDPPIEVVPTEGQIDHLIGEIRKVTDRGERVFVTTLTKKMACLLYTSRRTSGLSGVPMFQRRSDSGCKRGQRHSIQRGSF